MANRYVGGDELLENIPALAGIARDPHRFIVIQKSAQVGATELMVNMAIWAADTGYASRGHSFFVMPTDAQMRDFVHARFDRAIQESPSLRARLVPEPPATKRTDNTRLKHLGNGLIFFRGSESPRNIASVDADFVFLDEYDQMNDGILALAKKRLASSRAGRLMVASTPRYPEAGINELYLQSDQRRYHIPCPHCGHRQPLSWEENVDLKRELVVCSRRRCRAPMDVTVQGDWVPQAPSNGEIHGYHLSRLYSPWLNLRAMIEASAATTPSELQEFYNSDLGETFVAPGGGLSLDELDRCREPYHPDDYAGEPTVMGVDPGRKLHVIIREAAAFDDVKTPRKLWFVGELDHFEELDALWDRYNVQAAVVDGQPEMRLAAAFASRHDKAYVARYDRQAPGYECSPSTSTTPRVMHLNRVEAIELTFERVRTGLVSLPNDARGLGGRPKQGFAEYYREMMAPKRTIERDTQGNYVSRWLEHGRADHYAHAEVYARYAELEISPLIPAPIGILKRPEDRWKI